MDTLPWPPRPVHLAAGTDTWTDVPAGSFPVPWGDEEEEDRRIREKEGRLAAREVRPGALPTRPLGTYF